MLQNHVPQVGAPDLRNLARDLDSRESGDLALALLAVIVFVLLVISEVFGEGYTRDRFPEQLALLADPHAVDVLLVDADDRERLAARLQEHNVSRLERHGILLIVAELHTI